MPRALIPLLAALLLAFGAFACNGDDDNGDTDPDVSVGASRTPEETDDGDPDKSPPLETPDDNTPDPTLDDGRTPSPDGIPAVAPPDIAEFLAQFQTEINFKPCTYNPTTLLADCADLGKYALDPAPRSQADCEIGIVGSTAELLRCLPEEPRTSIYYDIQE
jgi:hypothetical protein